MIKRLICYILTVNFFMASAFGHAQQPSDITQPQQVKIMQKATTEQQNAVQEIMQQKGGLTPEAIEILKTRPEFQGLKPEDILKGKEKLQKKEAEKMEPPLQIKEKVVIGEENAASFFEKYRQIGEYQAIPLDIKPFGYDFFRDAAIKVLADRKDIPVPSEYVIGPGDEVKILLWGRVNAQYNLIVDRDGNITVPQIGPLHVAGMTFEKMTTYLIQQSKQIVGANINVTMGTLKSIPIFVLGDVKGPGSYTIGSFSTVTDVLLMSGGPTDIGSMRNIQLRRNDKTIAVFDLYDLLLKGDKSKDKMLQSGDIVFIPTSGALVGVAGNVKRPAIYELKDKRDLLNLFDMAGGIIPSAYTQQIQVERIQKNERTIVVDINDKDLTKSKDFMLQDGDLVKVFPIVDKDVNVVFLAGNVKRPGKYEYKTGMRVKDLIKDPTDLLKETHFEYALIKRIKPPVFKTELIPFNLGKFLFDGDVTSNIELEPQDSIYIFSKWFFKDKPFITVEGEVRKGYRFDLAENMRVRDVILNAGDLTKNAYLKKGEVIRVDDKREYKTIYFNVAKAMVNDHVENLILQDEDRVIIHSIWEEKWKETVSISGEVKNPQEFVLTESMSVSDLVFKAGGLTRDAYSDEAELYRTDWKTKEITLQRFNLKRAIEGDPTHNIKLKDMDKVVVHSIWEKVYKKTVSISGEVTKPGTYLYAENMTVSDLIFASGNVLESAYMDEAEISSQIIEGGKSRIEHRKINLKRAMEGDPAHNLLLTPYDRVFVKQISNWHEEKFVSISGEVLFPGKYILKKGEKISSLIERGGGYTDNAYLRGAVFTREHVKELQQKGLNEMILRLERDLLAEGSLQVSASLSKEEIEAKKVELEQKQKFIELLKNVKVSGRMSIKLVHLRLLKNSEYDIELEHGDALFIPMKNSVVDVIGSVMSQGSYIYSAKLDYKDYLEMAGGYTRYADKDNVYVLKVDGSARKLSRGFFSWNDSRSRWELSGFDEEVKDIEPGDTIVVPEKLERIAWLREVKDITQILFQIAVTTGVITALF